MLASSINKNIKLSPILIVANHSYSLIEKLLKGIQPITVHSMKNHKADKLDSYLDDVFTSKDSNGNYCIYLLSES